MTHEEFAIDQGMKRWNIFFSVVFVVLVLGGVYCLDTAGALPKKIRFADALLLFLATFRLIRLFVYDHITLLLRDSLQDLTVVQAVESGEKRYEYAPSRNAFKRTLAKLFGCPWCLGVWLAAIVAFSYFRYPQLWVVFFILALSGAASAFILLLNLVGWSAEARKIEATKQ
jgi:hypothetical protein